MAAPEIRFLIKAEGAAEAIAAMRQIREEEQKLAAQEHAIAEEARKRGQAEVEASRAAAAAAKEQEKAAEAARKAEEKARKEAEEAPKRRAEAIQKAGSGIAGFGAAMTGAVTIPLVALAKESIEAYGRLDALKRGLETVMGSAKAAGKEFENLKPVAQLPGLGLEEAVQGSVNLQAIGFSADKARQVMLQFGNALGSVGRGKEDLQEVVRQLGQLEGRGKVTADNLKPIIERVPQVAKILKDTYGTVDSEQISKILASQKKGSSEFIDQLIADLAKLPRVTGGIRNDLENTGDAINQTLATIGESMSGSVHSALELFNDMLTTAQGLAKSFKSLPEPAKNMAVALAAALAVIGPLALAIGGLVMAAGTMSTALAALGLTFGAVAAPVAALGAAIAGLGYIFLEYKRQSADPLLRDTSALVKIFDDLGEAFDTVKKAFSSGGSWSSMGEWMGKLKYGIKVVVALLVGGVQQLASIMREAWDQFNAFRAGTEALAKAGYKGPTWMFTSKGRETFSSARNKYLAEHSAWEQNNASTEDLMARILADEPSQVNVPESKKKKGKDKPPPKPPDAKKVKDWADEIRNARKAADLAQVQATQALNDELYRLQEDEAKRQFELGQLSVEEFFRGRREAMEKKQAENDKALGGKFAAIMGLDPEQAGKDLAKILEAANSSIAVLKSKMTTGNKGDAGEANYKRLQQIAELERLIGEIKKKQVTDEKALLDLDREKANGLYKDAAKKMADDLEKVKAAKQEELDKLSSGKQDTLTTDTNIATIQSRNMPTLRQDLQAMSDAAVTPEQVKAVQDMTAAFREWGMAVDTTHAALLQFKTSVGELMVSGITDFFMNFATQQKSVGEAALDMAQGFVQAVLQMITQALVMKVVFSAMGLAIPGGSLASAIHFADGGAVQKRAAGGAIFGPGTGTSDSIPAMLSNGEHVWTAEEVRAAGGHREMYALRAAVLSGSRYAEGGAVGAAAGAGLLSAESRGRMEVGLEPGLVERRIDQHLSGPGFKVVVEQIGRHQKKVKGAMG